MDGFVAFVYIDDLLLITDTRHEMEKASNILVQTLKGLDLILAEEKTVYCESIVTFLGLEVNLCKRIISCSKQLNSVRETSLNCIEDDFIWSFKDLEMLIGKLNWLTTAMNFGKSQLFYGG